MSLRLFGGPLTRPAASPAFARGKEKKQNYCNAVHTDWWLGGAFVFPFPRYYSAHEIGVDVGTCLVLPLRGDQDGNILMSPGAEGDGGGDVQGSCHSPEVNSVKEAPTPVAIDEATIRLRRDSKSHQHAIML